MDSQVISALERCVPRESGVIRNILQSTGNCTVRCDFDVGLEVINVLPEEILVCVNIGIYDKVQVGFVTSCSSAIAE